MGAAEQRIASIGQVCEVAVMAGLGLAIVRYGFKPVMIVGILAYTLRCLVFAAVFAFALPFAARLALAGLGQALHGLCFGCFLAAAFMYIDRVIRIDLRGSMQTLYGTTVLGWDSSWAVMSADGSARSSPPRPARRRCASRWESRAAVRPGVVHQSGDIEYIRDWPGIWLSCAAIAAALALAIFALLFPRRTEP
jgi:hypothetical protein